MWVLTERGRGDNWEEIDRSKNHYVSFKKAMAGGLVALETMVDDLDIGPRHPPADDPSDNIRKHSLPRKPDGDSEETQAKRPSLFGFGPAR